VISKKKKNIDFFGQNGTFYRRKTDLYEKKNLRCSAFCRDFMAVQMQNLVPPHFLKDPFKLENAASNWG
jgi:hypothetical protein